MIENVKKYVKSISILLQSNGENNLAHYMDQLLSIAEEDPEYFIDNVKRLFGGMGSLNDVVFSLNGKPLIEENNQLDELRRKLYEACFSYKYKS
ncbi:DUF6966 domain-containing protein [Kosakonia sacchari]|uniref:NitrOD5 domain-containing protein n=1 Tax=Kosakonia sacchari TaxID=1158459 RepID=A0ABZ0MX49_9ENTR|nr:NitrOD5 domain-containing protein [Kosakonia sacchari]WOZ79320.1 NitrOD5 domain-containing protein [Kosakonia sacchari]